MCSGLMDAIWRRLGAGWMAAKLTKADVESGFRHFGRDHVTRNLAEDICRVKSVDGQRVRNAEGWREHVDETYVTHIRRREAKCTFDTPQLRD